MSKLFGTVVQLSYEGLVCVELKRDPPYRHCCAREEETTC